MTRPGPTVEPVLVAIVVEGLISRLGFGIIAFTLPLYAVYLGLSVAETGVLISLNLAASMVLKPVLGRVVDRLGFKPSLVIALLLRSLVSLLFAFSWLPWQLFAIRGAHGASRSLRDPAAYALIAEHSTRRSLASSFAWYASAKGVSGQLGHALAGLLLAATAQAYSLVFGIAAMLTLVAVFVVWRYVPAGRGRSPNPVETPPPIARGRDRRPVAARVRVRYLPIMGFGFLMNGTAKMIGGLFPLLAIKYAGLTEAQTSLIYILAAGVMLVCGPAFGWLSDRVSRRLVLLVRGAANGVSSVIFLVAPSLVGIASGRLVDEIGKAAFKPAWGALMAEHSEQDRRNRAHTMAMLSIGEDAGGIAGPILAGLLWSAWGVAAMLGVRIALAVLSEIYAIVIVRSKAAVAGLRVAAQNEVKQRG